MKNIFTLLFVCFTIALVAQKNDVSIPLPHTHSHKGVVCGIGEPMPGLVIPPRSSNLNASQNATTFQVTYTDNVPIAARNAFDRATVIIGELFNSPMTITVGVEASADLEPGTLAGASPGTFLRDFSNAPKINTWYPIALAEKLEQQDFNANSMQTPFDITVTYNSNVNWNFTSTNVAFNQFDFVTVILHELMHGLGFSSLGNVDEDTDVGSLRLQGFPSAYSVSIQNVAGANLLETFPDPSLVLGEQLTSNNLFMQTQSFADLNQRVRIFAPSPFNPGSSISHLDQFTFTNTPHALMRPGISPGAIIHDPGSFALDILYDIGWRRTSIIHEPGPVTDDVNQPYVVEAFIQSEIGFDASTFQIHYSRDTFATQNVGNMIPTGVPGQFTITLPAPGERATYQYFFTVDNSRQQPITTPTLAPTASFFEFFYDVDEILPQIVHEPVTILDDKSIQLVIEASITDVFTGVDSAFVEYSFNGVPQGSALMERNFADGFRPDLYIGIINLPANGLNENDRINYQIVANDKSPVSNIIISPATNDTYEVLITKTLDPINVYVNDFEIDNNEFTGEDFSITTPTGFTNQAIHSVHPYTSAGVNNTRDFITSLRLPIILRQTASLIEFEEVVLVEPGNPGTSFGDIEFWDFVIVEGRKSNSTEWLPFLDGYDAGADADWLNTYLSGLQPATLNSTALGNANLFRNRTIDMQENGNFSEGDTLLVRFRLFSDSDFVGWGWAIDNLRIQDTPVSIEDFVDNQDFKIFPNPSTEQFINIQSTFKQPVEKARVLIHNIHGQLLFQQTYNIQNQSFIESIPISNLPKGMLLLTLSLDNKEQSIL